MPWNRLAQIGAGYRDAIFVLAGGLFGAVAYSYSEPMLKQTALGKGDGKLIFSDFIGIPYWQGALALAAVLAVILILLERWRPWRADLGQDCDGSFAVAQETGKAVVLPKSEGGDRPSFPIAGLSGE